MVDVDASIHQCDVVTDYIYIVAVGYTDGWVIVDGLEKSASDVIVLN